MAQHKSIEECDQMDLSDQKPNSTAATWRYSSLAIALHWTIAVLIIGMIALGWYMLSVEKQPNSAWLFDLHKSLGLTVFGLIALRILWRASHRPEGLPDSVPMWQAKLATLIHWLLYAGMIVMPLTGYLGASYSTHPPKFFGLGTPIWATPNQDLSEQFFTIHGLIAWALVVVISLHVLAGLKHLLIDRDRVFQRMWFGGPTNSG
jgi:cytochrome b561